MSTRPATSVTSRLSATRTRLAVILSPNLNLRRVAGIGLALSGVLAPIVAQANILTCTSGQVISATTSCDIPLNTPYTVEAWGAGGGGGSRINGGAGGGGGGAYCMLTGLAIGSSITLTVGIGGGGTGSSSGNNGTVGGNTTVTGTGITVTASGGFGGQSDGTGGAGGSTSACTTGGGVGYAGGNGGTGASPSTFPGGGGGGGSAGATGDGSTGGTGTSAAQGSGGSGDAAGGNGGRNAAASAQAGNAPGGGGGGGSDNGAQGPGAGGGVGQVRVTFTETPLFSALSPASGSYMNASGTLGYSLSIAAAAAGNIVFTRTGGTADASSPRVCTYQGTAVNSGAHSIGLAANANGCTAPLSLVDGAVYAIRFFASNSSVDGTVSRYDNAVTGVTYDITPPSVAGSTPIVLTDSDASGTLNVGDTIVLTFSEPVLASNLTLVNLAVNNGHTLSTSNVVANAPSNGYASSFTITLAGTPTLAVGDTLTITSANVVDRAANPAAGNAVFTVPAFAPGPPTGVGGTVGNAQVSLGWTAPAGNGGAAITGYQVQVSTSSGGSYANAAGTCAPATTNTSTSLTCTATGLTNGTAYFFKVATINSVGTGAYSSASSGVTPLASQTITGFAPSSPVVFGAAPATLSATGGASGSALVFATGSASSICTVSGTTVTFVGAGVCNLTANQAGNANYSAAPQVTASITISAAPIKSYTGPSPAGSGNIATAFTGGNASCAYATSQFSSTPTPPTGVTLTYGVFSFTTNDCGAGSTLNFTITYPQNLSAGTRYYKFGPEFGASQTPHWYVLPGAVVSGNQISFSITDNGAGDSNPVAGFITDPGGPGLLDGSAATAIPTLSEWGLILLAGLLALFAMAKLPGGRPR